MYLGSTPIAICRRALDRSFTTDSRVSSDDKDLSSSSLKSKSKVYKMCPLECTTLYSFKLFWLYFGGDKYEVIPVCFNKIIQNFKDYSCVKMSSITLH